ncbi:MAG: ATP-binding protein [Candidatus Hydrogenedentes bacterium]|nr:ATP-binding protein [Candidatus Hydrogenedentota bacterium]
MEKGDYGGGGRASAEIKSVLSRVGVSSEIIKRAVIAVFEAEMNIIIHSYGGQIIYRVDEDTLEVEAIDTGPGIPNIVLAMKEGYSTAPPEARELGYGAGMGLPNIKKNTDFFYITASPKGTTLKFHIRLTPQENFEEIPVKVIPESKKCKHCLDCIKECPTKAIRLRGDEVKILYHRCVNCNRCVEICPTGVFDFLLEVIQPHRDGFLDSLSTVIIPSPVASKLYIEGKWFPWRDFMKEEYGVEVVTLIPWDRALEQTVDEYLSNSDLKNLPVISPVCPSVIQWIQTEYPSLIGYVAPYLFSFIASIDYYVRKGKVLYVPICPSQIATLELLYKNSNSIKLLHPRALFDFIRESRFESTRGDKCISALESQANYKYAISGVVPVKKFMDKLEKGRVGKELKIVELYACYGGCYGFPFTDLEPHYLSWLMRSSDLFDSTREEVKTLFMASSFKPRKGIRLGFSIRESLEKLALIEDMSKSLPGRDCGVCGAPRCLDFAEEMAIYNASIDKCPYIPKKEKES